ncbi:hypothetical protein CDD83_316 [Cordyceps sp. RAO-2017]|nr:hypothetical protein CDD83_316 [Cordyceps sp. RAO-2017]
MLSQWSRLLILTRLLLASCQLETKQNPIHAPWGPRGASTPQGFSHCLFYDDFSDRRPGSLPSPSKWTLDLGTSYPGGPERWGTGELQTYTNDEANIRITPRNTLKITPIRHANGTWTSSRIETTARWDWGCRTGRRRVRAEARIRLGDDPKSKQLGIWPAFWALGSEFRGNFWNWPGIGEVDIMESLNGESKVWNVVHCGFAPGGPCDEFNGVSSATEGISRGEWHVFAFDIHCPTRRCGSNGSMSWYIDGNPRQTLTYPDVKNASAWNALVENKKMLLLNVAVGGGFPDGVAGFKTPTNATAGGDGASMEVDYVAVWEQRWQSGSPRERCIFESL